MTTSYVPGVCNIGPAEAARRRDTGIASGAVGVAVLAACVGFRAPRPARLIAAVPLAGGASGLLQASRRFCAGFGLRGVENFGVLGGLHAVPSAADRSADRRSALRLLAASGSIGLAAAALGLLLPDAVSARGRARG